MLEIRLTKMQNAKKRICLDWCRIPTYTLYALKIEKKNSEERMHPLINPHSGSPQLPVAKRMRLASPGAPSPALHALPHAWRAHGATFLALSSPWANRATLYGPHVRCTCCAQVPMMTDTFDDAP